MDKIAEDRRSSRRYSVHLPLQYRVSQRGKMTLTGAGTTREMSSNGLSFRCRKPLPLGSHVEVTIDWPARYGDQYPIDLLLTGFIVRSDTGRIAVRVTSRRFRILAHSQPFLATA